MAVHGHRFSYDLVPSTARSLDKVRIVCPKHGVFTQRFANHLSGRGCPACAQGRREALALSKWKDRARQIHGYRYDYSLVSRVSGKVKIGCPDHGLFEQSGNAHIHQGIGCPACGRQRISEAASLSPEDWEKRAMVVHGQKYQYTGDYRRAADLVTVICRKHGSFQQRASLHIKGMGCPGCANEQRSQEKKALWEDPGFRAKMLKVFEENSEARSETTRKLWEDPDFRNRITKLSRVLWDDPDFRARMALITSSDEHKTKLALAASSQSGRTSRLEDEVYEICVSAGHKVIRQYNIGPWTFDLFLPDHKVLIECQGEYWHSDRFPKKLSNDKAKRTFVGKSEFRLVAIYEHYLLAPGLPLAFIQSALDGSEVNKDSYVFKERSLRRLAKSLRIEFDKYCADNGIRNFFMVA